jgi:hypothetical protein
MGPPGHFGIAFAAKSISPKASLIALLVASEALDLLSFGFMALGIEKMGISQVDLDNGIQELVPGSIPWSHGLLMSIVWSLLIAAIAYLISKERRTGAIFGLVVFSHWILDFIVHTPDLPIFFAGSPRVGLGLWGSGPGLIASGILEVVLLTGGVIYYVGARKRTKLQNNVGSADPSNRESKIQRE